jgi:hypothetical protein
MEEFRATIERVEQDGDWFSIFTNDGTIKKLTTKREDLAGQAATLRLKGVPARIKFTPNKKTLADGRVFNNYYFEGAEEAPTSNGSGAVAGIDKIEPSGRKTDPEDAWRMSLAAGAKLAVATMPLMPVESRDFETQKRIALAWADFIVNTPKGETSFAREFAGGPGYRDDPTQGAPDNYHHRDDDIPF